MKEDIYEKLIAAKWKVQLLLNKFANNGYFFKKDGESNHQALAKAREEYANLVRSIKDLDPKMKWQLLEKSSADYIACLEKVLATKVLGHHAQRAVVASYVKEHCYRAYYLKDLNRQDEIDAEAAHQLEVIQKLISSHRVNENNILETIDQLSNSGKFDLSAYSCLLEEKCV